MDTPSHAIIETGGKQYLIKQGDVIKVEKLIAEPTDKLTFKDMLNDKASVTATVVGQTRAKKVSGRIFRNKTRSKRYPHGHKQHLTELKIESIV